MAGNTSSAPTPESCTKDSLTTLTKGTLTFGTDQPAYPPWFVDDDPSNGKGFESAVAYAVAGKLGGREAALPYYRSLRRCPLRRTGIELPGRRELLEPVDPWPLTSTAAYVITGAGCRACSR